jgi:hypothetical protein
MIEFLFLLMFVHFYFVFQKLNSIDATVSALKLSHELQRSCEVRPIDPLSH